MEEPNGEGITITADHLRQTLEDLKELEKDPGLVEKIQAIIEVVRGMHPETIIYPWKEGSVLAYDANPPIPVPPILAKSCFLRGAE